MDAPYFTMNDLTRLDNSLMPMTRLFYSEICANITSNHGAFVNDDYYAGLFEVSPRQVRKWRTELVEHGYTVEKVDSNTGMKCIYPTKTIEENILRQQGLKKPKVTEITYTTREGKILHNASEAKQHYHAMINLLNITEDRKSKLFLFINTFLEAIFDDTYFNKVYAKQRCTKEFFQFVLNCLTVDEIYAKAMYVFADEKYPSIRQPDYYILTCIANAYKDEFNSKLLHGIKNEKRKESKRL